MQFQSRQIEVLFHCDAKFLSAEHDLSNYLTVHAGFDRTVGTYACYFTTKDNWKNHMELASDVEISVTPGPALTSIDATEKHILPFYTAFKSLTDQIILTNVDSKSEIVLKSDVVYFQEAMWYVCLLHRVTKDPDFLRIVVEHLIKKWIGRISR